MNPWMRLLLVFAVAVSAALFLKVLPPIVVLVLFIGGVAAVNYLLKRDVKSEKAEMRSRTRPGDLRLERRDPFGLLGYPFALFHRGADPLISELHWGTWRGVEVKRFGFSCLSPSGTRTHLSCAMVPLGAGAPSVVIESEMFRPLLAEVPMTRAGETASASGPRFEVRSADPAFASSVLGSPVMRWVEGLEEAWGFEVSGSLVLAYGPPSAAAEVPLERAQAFAELLPARAPTRRR